MSLAPSDVLRQQEMADLETEVSAVAARLNRDHADLVALTHRPLDEERWAGGGVRSPEHWLMLRAGLSPPGPPMLCAWPGGRRSCPRR